jgi:ribosomal protein S18 acetylase RimI-like enzyme
VPSADGEDHFRFPEEKDLQALYRLDHEAFKGDEGYPYFFLRQLFDVHRQDFLVLERDGELLGYALAVLATDGERAAWLLALGVHPEHRGQGHGDALLLRAIRHARDSGARRMNLAVRPGNVEAIALYGKHRFHRTVAEPVPGYYGEDRARILMSRPLD